MARANEATITISITNRQREEFCCIVNAYKDYTVVPLKDNWIEKSSNELWLHHIGQVMVVGGATSKERFDNNRELQALVNFDALERIMSDDVLQKKLNEVLRKAGVRYAGKDYQKCAKSSALTKNLRFLSSHPSGLKGMLEELASWKGEKAELRRVEHLMQHLSFMKSKSARDFLMGLGVNQNTLALDVRIANVMRYLKVEFPTPGDLGKESIYRATEQVLIEQVCMPLNVQPLFFDRLLFQHESRIVRSEYKLAKLF